MNPPDSLKTDTGHTSRLHSSACTSAKEKGQQPKTAKEDVKQDVEAQYPAADSSEDTTLTQSDQLHTLPTFTNEVRMPAEKVGCILVTRKLSFTFRKTSFFRRISHAIIVKQIFV